MVTRGVLLLPFLRSCDGTLKRNCTDSEDGWTLDHHLDSWLQSEVQLFHRAISLALFFLAVLILAVGMIFHTASIDLAVLLGAMVPVAIFGLRRVGSVLPSRRALKAGTH